MAIDRIHRQVLLDLDHPACMEFVRALEFSTYLLLRRYMRRSDKRHTMGLEYYAKGLTYVPAEARHK